MPADPETLANFVAGRMKEDPKVKAVVDEAHLLDGLQEHAGWRRLAEKIRSHEAGWMESVTRRLVKGERVPQDEIDYRRGFYDGARWIIEHPAQAEASLEAAAQRAWREVRREQLLQQEADSSPYLIGDPPPLPQEGN